MAIRIARILTRLNVGGPARHVVWLTEALNDGEFESVLVTGTVPAGEQDMSDFACARGVEPIVISDMSREISPRDIVTTWKVFRLFRSYRPKIVHTHTAKAGTVGRIAGLLYRLSTRDRIFFVHTYHGHVFHSYYGPLKTRVFLAIERALALLNTDAIVVLAEQQFDEIHRRFRIGRPQQFHIIPLGIDLGEITVDRPARNELAIGIIGRLTPIKNHDLFLRGAARVSGVAYVVFGDGAERERLERLAQQLGVSNRVTFAGTWAAAEIYRNVDIVALTSRNEGTPLAIIEAMVNGIPIISTAVGAVAALLGSVEGKCEGYDVRERGITAASDDEVGFAAGLRRLIDDPQLRHRLASRGATFARSAFSKERLITDIIRLYRELLSRDSATSVSKELR